MASQIRYIPFIDFPENEANLLSFEYIPNFSDRGKVKTVLKRMTIEGHICATEADTPSLTDRIEGIRDAFEHDYGDLGLWINGSLTPHALYTNHPDNLSGTRVVYRSWPSGAPAEYANRRYYKVVLQALFRPLNVDQVIAFRETVRFMGNAGPRAAFDRRLSGPWQAGIIATNTTQLIHQIGEIWGLEGYPLGVKPGPLVTTALPNIIEHQDLRDEHVIPGTWVGNAFLEYGIRYTYVIESNTALGGAIAPNQY